jgi:hypothetical protein
MAFVKLFVTVLILTRVTMIATQLQTADREIDLSGIANVVSIRLICPESSPFTIWHYVYVRS